MQADTQPQLADITSLLGQTRQLAMLDVNDTPFLSVYLDTRPGMRGCRQFIEDKAARIRPQLPGMARLEFENAFNMVCREWSISCLSWSQGRASPSFIIRR